MNKYLLGSVLGACELIFAGSARAGGVCDPTVEICFTGIGDLAGGSFYSDAKGIAHVNGMVAVVGESSSTASQAACNNCREAVRYTVGPLQPLLTGPSARPSVATDVTLVGTTLIATGKIPQGAMRAQLSGSGQATPVLLPAATGAQGTFIGNSISDDGQTIVGNNAPEPLGEGGSCFKWTASNNTTILIPKVNPNTFAASNSAYGVSPNGSTTVGGSSSQAGFEGFFHPAPFTLCLPTGCGSRVMPDVPGGLVFSEAFGVSNSGIAVGYGSTASGEEAVRWVYTGGALGSFVVSSLGDLPGGALLGRALSISGDAQTVVGFGTSASGQEATIFHPLLGLQNLKNLLVNFGVTGLDNWTLVSANAISTNGLAIAGTGRNPLGQTEGWFVTLPDCDANGRWDAFDAPLPWSLTSRSVIDFDGTDDFVEVAAPSASLQITGNLTMEAWVYLHRLGVSQLVISFGAVGESLATNFLYALEVDAAGDVKVTHERADFSDVVITADTNLQAGRWYHLAVTRMMFSASTLEYSVYVDDQVPIPFGVGGAAAGGTGGTLRVGRGPGSAPDRPFDGLIGDVRIWNVARTPAQIAGSMFEAFPSDSTGLIALWPMDEPAGGTLADAVGSNDLAVVLGGSRLTVAADCNSNGIPDTCEADCNTNGITDACDLQHVISRDCDFDGRPDECSVLDVLADLLEADEASTEVFREGRDDPVSPTTFGTMIQRYGRPWKPGTGQTPGVGTCAGGANDGAACAALTDCPGGSCAPPAGTGATRDPAERLRLLTHDPSCLPTNVAQKALEELFAFEMLLGNEAFADAMDSTVGEGALGESISLDQVPGLFAFRGIPGINSLLDEELALLRGREIALPASADTPLNDAPSTNLNGNYPQFGSATRAAIYNRLRPNATSALGSIAYRSNYGFANTTTDAEASEAYPQGHGDSYGYYLTAAKAYLDAFGAARDMPVPPEFSLSLVESLQVPAGSADCGTLDCDEVVDDDGITHHVGFQSVRNMGAAMASRARAATRIVDLTFRRDYREITDTQLQDIDSARAWGTADWGRRGGTGAFLDWVVLNHLLPVPDANTPDELETVHRQRVDEVGLLASAVGEMQERVDAAGAGLNPLALLTNVVPFRIIQPGQLLNFLQGGSSAGQSHYGIVRDAAVEAIKNARGILMRANAAVNRLRGNESDFVDFEDQVRQTNTGLNDRLIEIFGLPSISDTSDNDGEDNDGDGVQVVGGVNDPDDDLLESMGTPDLRNSLVDAETMDELGWVERAGVGQLQLAMFELRKAALRAEMAEQALASLEALIQAKAENVALVREEQIESLEIRADACAELIRVVDRKEELAKAREQKGFLSRIGGLIKSMAVCAASSAVAGCGDAIKTSLGFVGEALGSLASGSDPPSGINNEFDAAREELRINCWQTASLATISNDQTIRSLEIELEDLLRRTPQAVMELVLAETQARQALAVVRKNYQDGLRLLDERERIRRVQTDKLQDFRFRDLAYRTFRNQALEQYGAFFDLAGRYVMLAARAFAYEYNERDEVAAQIQRLYQERLLGSELATDEGLESVIAQLDQKRQESEFLARLQKLSLFDNGGDDFSVRKNMLGLAIDPAADSPQQQLNKNKAFRAFLESNIVQELTDVPAFRQLASLDSDRDAGPAIVLNFSTEVAGRTIFGQRRGTIFGAPANFDTCSNPKLFEFAILLEGVDNPSALGVDSPLIFAHFIPVGTSMLRAPETGDCALRPVRSWEVVDQRIPGVSAAYRTPGTSILDSFGIPRLATSPDLNIINRFPVTQAQVRNTDTPIFQDELAGWSVWNTQWLLAIPGRQFADSADPADLVRKKLLILIYDADAAGNPRNPDQNLGIDDVKLRIKAYGKPS